MVSIGNGDLEESLLKKEEKVEGSATDEDEDDDREEEEGEEEEPLEAPHLMMWSSCPGRVRLQQVHSHRGVGGDDSDPSKRPLAELLKPLRAVVYTGSVFVNLMMACIAPFFEGKR